MNKSEKIPLLKVDSYSRYYRKDDSLKRKPPVEAALQQFGIAQRCLLKNHIAPHRLDFYLVFLVTEGEGIHSFGLHEHYVKKNTMCFIGPHTIQSWQSEIEEHKGYFCTFSDEFFNVGREDKHFLNTLPLFGIEGNGVLHLNAQQADYYLALFNMMKQESENCSRYSANIIRGHLNVLLNKAHSEFQQHACQAGTPNDPRLGLVKKFTSLFLNDINALSSNQTIHLKKIGDYAREIGVSQNHLNDTIKTVTGKSAGQLIKNQLIKRATLCLKYSTKSISEIAYSLGYDDPSYFARFYKRQTGRSPSEYR